MDMELSFGEKIKLLRENAELSQEELGQEIGMTQRKISYLEHNKYEPSIDDLRAFCQFFNISADYLLGFSKNLPFPHRKTKL
jgi:transcriptional regulator with XRE-family HTH domain